MTIKKMVLLASMALAAIAFAAPAAQATGPNISGSGTYSGFLQFEKLNEPGAGSTFGCQVNSEIEGGGGTTANVNTFEPVTTECEGTGIFTGCVLKEDFSNTSPEAPWVAHSNTAHDLVVTNEPGDITVRNVYEKCALGIPGSHLEFTQVTVTPDPTEGAISTLTVHGTDTTGFVTASGTLHGSGVSLAT